MIIQLNRTLSELQEEFHSAFPGLKIAFYQKEHQDHQGSPKKMEHPPALSVNQLNPDLVEGEIILDAEQSVADFEQEMETRFGLHIQVFRRSNALWLQTTSTDDWTLGTQNRKGLHSVQTF